MVILLCPKEWLGYCLRSDRKQQWNWSEYEFCSGSEYEFAQGVIMNDEGDAVEFSPRNARKVWSSEKKEVIGFLF